MILSASTQSQGWRDHFIQLHRVALSNNSLSQKLKEIAGSFRQQLAVDHSPYLRRKMEIGISALEQAAEGDYSGIGQQFHNLVSTPLEEAELEHLLFLVVKDVDARKPPHPLIIHCTLDRRVLEAQKILRSPAFLNGLAERLKVGSYPPSALRGRVQGVNIINHAGYVRYALFADLVYETDWTTSHVDGGLLFSVVAEDFIRQDLALVDALFPEEGRRLRQLGVLNLEQTKFLFNVFLSLHDTLGHIVPYPVHHWVKRLIGPFLLDPFEELGADTQFFWMTTCKKMRPFLAQILTEEETKALPILWLMKRICHYAQRGSSKDALHGDLMEDGDARLGILFWQYFLHHGVIARDGNHFRLDHDLLTVTVERLLDDWLAIEAELPGGVEPYSRALSDFYLKYRSSDRLTGRWEIPVDLRRSPSPL